MAMNFTYSTPTATECRHGYRRGPLFPDKLWDACAANRGLLTWSPDGKSFTCEGNESKFESSITTLYPGLVEIPTLANFRRQLREYNFQWKYNVETDDFEFSHPCFVRSQPDLLPRVLTRRASFRLDHNGRTMKRRGRGTHSGSSRGRGSLTSSASSSSSGLSPSRRHYRRHLQIGLRPHKSGRKPSSVPHKHRTRFQTPFGRRDLQADFIYDSATLGNCRERGISFASVPIQPAAKYRLRCSLKSRELESEVMKYNPPNEDWFIYSMPWFCEEIAKETGLLLLDSDPADDGFSRDDVFRGTIYGFDDPVENLAFRCDEVPPLVPGKLLNFVSELDGTWICRPVENYADL